MYVDINIFGVFELAYIYLVCCLDFVAANNFFLSVCVCVFTLNLMTALSNGTNVRVKRGPQRTRCFAGAPATIVSSSILV